MLFEEMIHLGSEIRIRVFFFFLGLEYYELNPFQHTATLGDVMKTGRGIALRRLIIFLCDESGVRG